MTMKTRKLGGGTTAIALVAIMGSVWSGALIAGDINNGKKHYSSYCVSCHGATGTSVMPGAPNFRQGERLMQPDMMLRASIQSGKNACPSFQGMLNDRDIMDVISYIRTLN